MERVRMFTCGEENWNKQLCTSVRLVVEEKERERERERQRERERKRERERERERKRERF